MKLILSTACAVLALSSPADATLITLTGIASDDSGDPSRDFFNFRGGALPISIIYDVNLVGAVPDVQPGYQTSYYGGSDNGLPSIVSARVTIGSKTFQTDGSMRSGYSYKNIDNTYGVYAQGPISPAHPDEYPNYLGFVSSTYSTTPAAAGVITNFGNGGFNWQDNVNTSAYFKYDIKTVSQSNPIVADKDAVETAYKYAILGVDGTKDIVRSYVSSGGDLTRFITTIGERITTGLSGTITRIGSVLTNLGVGLLDVDVQKGFDVFYQTITDPNRDTDGLLSGPENRRALQEVLNSIDEQRGAPIQPVGSKSTTSKFDAPVTAGKVIAIDPDLASGFEYKSGLGDPPFTSIVLPAFESSQNNFFLEEYVNGAWSEKILVRGLREYTFAQPIDRFRITGIDAASNVSLDQSGWISGISFARDGRFTGSITALPLAASVPEPATWVMIILGFGAVGYSLRKRQAIKTAVRFA